MDVIAVAPAATWSSRCSRPSARPACDRVGIDLSAFGMIRALDDGPSTPVAKVEGEEDHVQTTTLYCYLGDITNLAVARGGQCLFTRVAPFGMESIAQRVAERGEMSLEDARDLLLDIGLEESIDSFDGR